MKNCPICKKDFLRRQTEKANEYNARTYCSLACVGKKKYLKAKETRICPVCKGDFQTNKSDWSRLCSQKCAKKFFDLFQNDMSMTQAEVADKLNLNVKTVQRIENRALTKLYRAMMESPIIMEYINDHRN